MVGNALKIVNITDSSQPAELGSYPTNEGTYSLAVWGNYVYLVQSGWVPEFEYIEGAAYIRVVDASNPTQPSSTSLTRVDGVEALAVSNNRLYATGTTECGLQVFDLTDRANPAKLGQAATHGEVWQPRHIAASGNTVLVTDRYAGLEFFSISDTGQPESVRQIAGIGASNVVISRNLAYVVFGGDGLRMIDISNPASPTTAGTYGSGYVQGLAVSGSNVYASCFGEEWGMSGSFFALDATDPENISSLGGCANTSAGRISLAGDRAYVAGNGALDIVDIAGPGSPVRAGGCATDYYSNDIEVCGQYAYIAASGSGLGVVDVSNSSQPFVVRTCDAFYDTLGVSASGDRAYVVGRNDYDYASDGGLGVFDLSQPAAPSLLGAFDTEWPAYDVAVSENRVYIVNSVDGLQIVDVANSSNPLRLGGWTTEYRTKGLALFGNYALLACEGYGLKMIDVSSPTRPVLIGMHLMYIDNPTIAVSGDLVYVVNGYGVLEALRLEQSDQCVVYGYVKDSLGNPVQYASVSIDAGGESYRVDENGRYVFENIPAGTYTVSASPGGWPDGHASVTLVAGQTVQAPDIVFQLQSITGCVRDDLGNPIEEAEVELYDYYSYPIDYADANGNYTLNDIRPGSHRVRAFKPGYTVSVDYVDVTAGQPAVLDLVLSRHSVVSGHVRDDIGNPIEGAIVQFSSYSAVTDSTGFYSVGDVEPIYYYEFTVIIEGRSLSLGLEVTVQPGKTTVDITVPRLSTVRGSVKDDLGNPIAGATITLGYLSAETNSTGGYVIPNVEPGYYDCIEAAKPGYTSSGKYDLVITPGETLIDPITLVRLSRVSGTVKDNLGNPIEGATVEFGNYRAETDSNGSYLVQDVWPGTCVIRVNKQGWTQVTARDIQIMPGETTVPPITMQLGRLFGTVTGPNGYRESGATVYLTPGDHTTTTELDGACSFENIYPGNYTVEATKAGLVSASGTVTVIGGVTSYFSLQLDGPDSVSGVVTDKQGNPLYAADVWVFDGVNYYYFTTDLAFRLKEYFKQPA